MDRRITKEEGEEQAVKPTRSFRYEDYSTRRVFLRSYPLQWDWSPAHDDDEKGGLSPADAEAAAGNRAGDGDGDECYGSGSRRWKRQVVAAVIEWGEDKLLLLRRARKRLTLYLIGCGHHGGHGHGRRALPFPSAGGSCTVPMLTSR